MQSFLQIRSCLTLWILYLIRWTFCSRHSRLVFIKGLYNLEEILGKMFAQNHQSSTKFPCAPIFDSWRYKEADFMMIIPREDLSCFRIQLVDFAPIHWPRATRSLISLWLRDKLVMLILREGSCSLMPDKDGLLLLA